MTYSSSYSGKTVYTLSAYVTDSLTFSEQITLLCLGPLTNVALAIRLDPLFVTNLKQVVVLGGSTEVKYLYIQFHPLQ